MAVSPVTNTTGQTTTPAPTNLTQAQADQEFGTELENMWMNFYNMLPGQTTGSSLIGQLQSQMMQDPGPNSDGDPAAQEENQAMSPS